MFTKVTVRPVIHTTYWRNPILPGEHKFSWVKIKYLSDTDKTLLTRAPQIRQVVPVESNTTTFGRARRENKF